MALEPVKLDDLTWSEMVLAIRAIWDNWQNGTGEIPTWGRENCVVHFTDGAVSSNRRVQA